LIGRNHSGAADSVEGLLSLDALARRKAGDIIAALSP